MLSGFRTFAQSWAAKILMALLIVSFGVWGIHDVFKARISDAVVTAGSREVSSADFKRLFDGYLKQVQEQTHQQITAEDAVAHGLDVRALNDIGGDEAVSEMMRKIGVRPSDQLILAEIRKVPAFFDRVTGKFDEKTYQQLLGENGLTPARFEQTARDQVARDQFLSGVAAGLKAPSVYGALFAAYGLENRTLGYFEVTEANIEKVAPPTDAQLNAFIVENAAQLRRPEFRALSIVRFSTAAMAPSMTVNPADLQKLYDFRKDTLGTPEKRTVVQVPVKSAADGQKVAARLKAGEDPRAVAKAIGTEPVIYAAAPKSAIPDRKVADAAFSLSAGQSSDLITGDLGMAVIKVEAVAPGKMKTIEEVKPELEAQIRKEMAQQKVYDTVQKFEDAHSGGSTIAEAAKTVGATVISMAPVSAQGADETGKPATGVDPKVLKTAFDLPPGGESEVEDAGGGEYYAVRVDRVVPPALPNLNDIRPLLTRYWTLRETSKRLQDKANALSAQVRAGQSLEKVAAQIGAGVKHAAGLTRATAGQNKEVSADAMNRLFNAKVGESFVAQGASPAAAPGQPPKPVLIVGRVEAITPGPVLDAARVAAVQRAQITPQVFRDITDAARDAAGRMVKVKTNLKRARQALGVTDEDAAKADAANTPDTKGAKAG